MASGVESGDATLARRARRSTSSADCVVLSDPPAIQRTAGSSARSNIQCTGRSTACRM